MKSGGLFLVVSLAIAVASACGDSDSDGEGGSAGSAASGSGKGGKGGSTQGAGGSNEQGGEGSGTAGVESGGAGNASAGGAAPGQAGEGGASPVTDIGFGDCITEDDGFATCQEYCVSRGGHCEQGGCGDEDATYLGWAAASEAACQANTGPQSIGNANVQCDSSLLFGPSGTHVRCCCGPGLPPDDCPTLPDTEASGGAGGAIDRDTTGGGAGGNHPHFSDCTAVSNTCASCNEVCAAAGETCSYQGCSAIDFFDVDIQDVTHLGWVDFQVDACTSFDVAALYASEFSCGGPFLDVDYVRCCCE